MVHAPGGDVLIVDDDPVLVELITDALQQQGYAVRTAYNGVEALMAIAADPPALVFLDLQIPFLRGGEVLTQVRNAHPEVAIVLITATPDEAAPYREQYQVPCVAKPFDMGVLLAYVVQSAARATVHRERNDLQS